MTHQQSTIDTTESETSELRPPEYAVLALMIAWSREEPRRTGEAMLFEMVGAEYVFGRGEAPSGGAGRALLKRLRPGDVSVSPPLASPAISREQLRIKVRRGSLEITRVGRCPMLLRGERVDRCSLSPGDALLLKDQLLLLCTARAAPPPLRDFPADKVGAFGEPDAFGLLGESPAIWRLRETLAFQAKAGAHTLVLGPSGAGKELCARAIHSLSARAKGPFVARNAATLPPGLVDAELFGNARNYPNPGMAERPGLVGAAHGGTLFLDEIGELPGSVHANLLRVLDGYGEYHRLGEAAPRRSDVRLVAATNRAPSALKHDLLARLSLRVRAPGLEERRDDIPLLVRHLLGRARERNPDLLARFTGPDGEIRVSPGLVEHLLSRPYTVHVRELDGLLWQAMVESPDNVVTLTDSLLAPPAGAGGPEVTRADGQRPPRAAFGPTPPFEEEASLGPSGEEAAAERARIVASITRSRGNLVKAAQMLGLSSRYVLYRLLRKHKIDAVALREDER